jgi:hypothetical protein
MLHRSIWLAALLSPALARAGDDRGCAAAAPRPILRRSAYSRYWSRRGRDNTLEEMVSLADGVDLEVDHAGCADAVSKEFVFRVKHAGAPATDLARWRDFAVGELKGLRLRRGEEARVADLVRFLGAASLPAAGPRGGHVTVCNDGSAKREQGCAPESGGEREFEVDEHAGVVVVRVAATSYL